MKVFYHSEGNLRPILDELVATGIDGLNPLEPHSHMDAESIRRRYPQLVLWGGVDNAELLVRGDPQRVRRRILQLIDLGRDGGLLIGSTGQIHPGCQLENLLSMIETVRAQAIAS
jgi:uroporphyrinogen decarboxylase